MKKQLLTLLFAITTVISFSQVPSYVPTNGLVGWWPFNGNANDESGNGNNGTVSGATLTVDRNGLANKAYSFDGINDLINVGNPTQLLNNPISYSQSVWVYLYDSPVNFNSYPIISKRHDDLGNDWATAVFRSTQKIWFFADDAYYSAATYANSSTLSFGTWKHAVFVKEDNTYKIYLDGVLDVSIVDSHIMSGSSNDLVFGAQLAWPQYYKGLIDDIAIFNRALSQQEITDLYNSCSNPNAVITAQGNTTFCQGSSVNLSATSGSNYTYEWFKDGVLINGANSSIYQAFTSGNYTVKVIDGACNTTSSQTTVSVLNCADLKEIESNKIEFYPNPTNDILNIDNGNYQAMSGYSIKIVSLTGAVIYNQPITTQSVQISMNDFGTTGLYFAQIIDPNNAIVDSK